jgi:DNA-binding transcriptional ArsR family regulator
VPEPHVNVQYGVFIESIERFKEARSESPRRHSPFCGIHPFSSSPRLSKSQRHLRSHYTLWCNDCVDQLSDVLTAISHPTRRAIIGLLANGPARFLDVAQPYSTALNAVTKHLKILERAGLIERQRQGREVMISFRAEPLRMVSGRVHEYEQFWNERLDHFEKHFKDKRAKEKKR